MKNFLNLFSFFILLNFSFLQVSLAVPLCNLSEDSDETILLTSLYYLPKGSTFTVIKDIPIPSSSETRIFYPEFWDGELVQRIIVKPDNTDEYNHEMIDPIKEKKVAPPQSRCIMHGNGTDHSLKVIPAGTIFYVDYMSAWTASSLFYGHDKVYKEKIIRFRNYSTEKIDFTLESMECGTLLAPEESPWPAPTMADLKRALCDYFSIDLNFLLI